MMALSPIWTAWKSSAPSRLARPESSRLTPTWRPDSMNLRGAILRPSILRPPMIWGRLAAGLRRAGGTRASTNRLIVSEPSSTLVGGTLGSNTVWNSSTGIIHVTNTVVVPPGATLTIGPGTVLLLAAGASITGTNSTINAAGEPGNVIYFLPADGTTVWGGLVVSGATGTRLLQHVE